MHSYYIWPSVITEMTDALLLAYVMTGKESYLAPLRSMAVIRLKHLKNPTGELKPGTRHGARTNSHRAKTPTATPADS
jgi:hypothetical protein